MALALLTFSSRQFFVVRYCSVRFRRLSSILGLYSLDARSILPPYCDNQKMSPNVTWRRKPPSTEKPLLRKRLLTAVCRMIEEDI